MNELSGSANISKLQSSVFICEETTPLKNSSLGKDLGDFIDGPIEKINKKSSIDIPDL